MKQYESASFYGCCMTLCPWLRFSRKLKGYGPCRAWGKVGLHFWSPQTPPYTRSKYFCPQKRVSSCEGVNPFGAPKPFPIIYFK